jgi:hypothetical protein
MGEKAFRILLKIGGKLLARCIAVAIKVRTFFNGPNNHVLVINIKASSYEIRCLPPSAFCYTREALSLHNS